MRLYVLLFALAACRAHAIPIDTETEPVQPVENKEPAQDESKLRSVLDSIPVAIVEEPVLKPDENSNDYIPSDDEPSINVKRLEIDLNNPGPPQRQEHETQNPEFYAERDYFVADIKQKLLDTENVFKKSVSEVHGTFENWVPNKEHLTNVQNDIKEMQTKFLAQLADLNKSLQSYINPQSTKTVITDPESVANLKEVENSLKVLEVNFKTGVETLSEGVKAMEAAKAEGDGSPTAENPSETGSPSPAPNPPSEQPSNIFGQAFQFFSDAIGTAINNVQNTFNLMTNQNNQQASGAAPPPDAVYDETAPSTSAPSFFETIQTQISQIGNIFQGNQNGQNNPPAQTSQPAQTNPIMQAINSNNFLQNIFNQFRPQTTTAAPTTAQKQPQSEPAKPLAAQEVPVKAEEKPQAVEPQPVEPVKDVPAPNGPIRQIVQNNPLVKGIVQRIQSISNPEKPRGKKPEQVPESVKSADVINEEEPIPATKGHGGYYGTNGNQATASVDNDSDRIVEKSLISEEKKEESPLKYETEKEVELAKEEEVEKETAVLSDKTE